MPKAKPTTHDAPPRALLVEKSPLLPLPKREEEDPFPPKGGRGVVPPERGRPRASVATRVTVATVAAWTAGAT